MERRPGGQGQSPGVLPLFPPAFWDRLASWVGAPMSLGGGAEREGAPLAPAGVMAQPGQDGTCLPRRENQRQKALHFLIFSHQNSSVDRRQPDVARRGLGLEPGSLKISLPAWPGGNVLGRHCLLLSSFWSVSALHDQRRDMVWAVGGGKGTS